MPRLSQTAARTLCERVEQAHAKVRAAFRDVNPDMPSEAEYAAAAEYVDSLDSPFAGATNAISRVELIDSCASAARDERVKVEREVSARRWAA